jgi:deazaflavin-dependent oxidoreductase (nitroreductase family)
MSFAEWIERTAVPWFTSIGLTKRTITLEVIGRRSGEPRRVTVAIVNDDSSRYLVSVHGDSNWVRNVRAAEGHAVILSGTRSSIKLVEIPSEARAPILQRYVSQGVFGRSAEEIASQFGVTPDASIPELEEVANRHPVFKIEPISSS